MARETTTRRGGKSASAYRTISEVAEEIDVPAHVLRFWESKFPAVKPLKRGGGRRYYRPEDVEALRRIRKLLYDDGFTIRGVQKLLKSHGGKPPAGVAPASPAEADPPQAAAPVEAPPEPAPAASPVAAEPMQPQLDFGLTSTQIDRLRGVLAELKRMRDDLADAA
ncbi:MAG: MerR family transcriptional regulator [Alphaproteobacteria bacterium]